VETTSYGERQDRMATKQGKGKRKIGLLAVCSFSGVARQGAIPNTVQEALMYTYDFHLNVESQPGSFAVYCEEHAPQSSHPMTAEEFEQIANAQSVTRCTLCGEVIMEDVPDEEETD
jgi:hypothetical protein